MQDFLSVMGMIIGSFPQSEYDRRIVLLTREAGKITAFAKGAKRPGNKFMGTTDLFSFGTFDLYVGKSSYTVQSAEISNYFEFLRDDLEASFYAQYFAELADYYARENNDESLLLLLLYRALQGLKKENLPNNYVRSVYEIKLYTIEGEFIPYEKAGFFSAETKATIDYIMQSSIEKLYNHPFNDTVLGELTKIAAYERKHLVDRTLKSLEILETLC